MKRFSLRYIFLTSSFIQLWLPLGFWLLFMAIGVIRGAEYMVDTTRAYLGAVVPLVGGIMAAYAVIEDPALELRFATPISSAQTMLERLVPTALIQVFFALTYQLFALAFHTDFSSVFPTFGQYQLMWIIPTISLMGLGCFAALAFAQAYAGALMVGLVWIVELVARSWFAGNRIGQYFLVFTTPFMQDHPALRINQISLCVLSYIFIQVSWMLLQKQERYI
jgi:hypothetical protein